MRGHTMMLMVHVRCTLDLKDRPPDAGPVVDPGATMKETLFARWPAPSLKDQGKTHLL
jgi:hypothetical protein